MTIESLVFSSGGINGIYFVGCLRALEEFNMIPSIKNIRGTSIGALFAVLIAIGFSSRELSETILHINTGLLIDVSLERLISFTENYGIDPGIKLKKVCSIFMEQKLGRSSVTFKELYEINPIHLTLVGSCISSGKPVYFNKDTFPDMLVTEAIRISSSIPFIFTPVTFHDNVYVDGALLDPYPVSAAVPGQILGFLIKQEKPSSVKSSLPSYITAIVNCIHKKDRLLKEMPRTIEQKLSTITIPASLTSINFSTTQEQKRFAIERGYQCTIRFLQQKRKEREHLKKTLSKCILKKKIIGARPF